MGLKSCGKMFMSFWFLFYFFIWVSCFVACWSTSCCDFSLVFFFLLDDTMKFLVFIENFVVVIFVFSRKQWRSRENNEKWSENYGLGSINCSCQLVPPTLAK
jgi:hypothetical protein